jgi:hypothetical protein
MKRHTRSLIARSIIVSGFAATTLLGALACQDVSQRELGYTHDDALNLTVAPDEPTEPFTIDVREFAGRWIGEAEESLAYGVGDGAAPTYRFPSGSTSIVLDIQLAANPDPFTSRAGTITFGEGDAPPAPTDPDVGYPTDVNYVDLLSYFPNDDPAYVLSWNKLPPREGFAYGLGFITSEADFRAAIGATADGTISLPDGVLKLTFDTTEVLDPWCAMQTSYEAAGNYSCVPYYEQIQVNEDGSCTLTDIGTSPGCPDLDALSDEEYDALYAAGGPSPECLGGVETPVATLSCDKVALCRVGYCSCDSLGCFSGTQFSASLLHLRRSGDTLVGEIDQNQFLNARGLAVPLGTIRFRRAP